MNKYHLTQLEKRGVSKQRLSRTSTADLTLSLNCDILPLVCATGVWQLMTASCPRLTSLKCMPIKYFAFRQLFRRVLDAVRHSARWQKCFIERHCTGPDTPRTLGTRSFSFSVLYHPFRRNNALQQAGWTRGALTTLTVWKMNCCKCLKYTSLPYRSDSRASHSLE